MVFGLVALSWTRAWGGAVPWALVAAGWVAAVAALAAASAWACLRGFAPAYCRLRSAKSAVALTFDDGPDPESTPRVLDELGRHGAHATFFVVGTKAAAYPQLLQRMIREGHEVACHGHRHDWRALLSVRRVTADLAACVEAVTAATGSRPRYYRPPYGVTTPALGVALTSSGLDLVGWSRRSWDTMGRDSPAARAARLGARVEPGDIILLHDAPERQGGRTPAGPDMLALVLSHLATRRLRAEAVGGIERGAPV
mgnify:CR=1 FL=1